MTMRYTACAWLALIYVAGCHSATGSGGSDAAHETSMPAPMPGMAAQKQTPTIMASSIGPPPWIDLVEVDMQGAKSSVLLDGRERFFSRPIVNEYREGSRVHPDQMPEHVYLQYIVRFSDGNRIFLRLPFNAKTGSSKTNDFSKEGSFFVIEPLKAGASVDWVAYVGLAKVAVSANGRIRIEIEGVDLRALDGRTRSFGKASIEGKLERSCYFLWLDPNGPVPSGNAPDQSQHYLDADWNSPYCRLHI